MNTPGHLPFAFQQGSLASFQANLKNPDGSPLDLSSYGARMKLVAQKGDEEAVFSLTPGDGLTLGGTAGTVLVAIPADDSIDAGEDVTAGFYDLILDPSGSPGPNSWTALAGPWIMRVSATR